MWSDAVVAIVVEKSPWAQNLFRIKGNRVLRERLHIFILKCKPILGRKYFANLVILTLS
jgi:hypothetical protein